MASISDVAEYILARKGKMTAMKLQKLCYYSQAWGLVWDEKPLFHSRCEAWANGPVFPELYSKHKGKFHVDAGSISKSPNPLSEEEKATVDAVISFYGDKSAVFLSELTHREAPWADSRRGVQPGERSNEEITTAAMSEFYESLV